MRFAYFGLLLWPLILACGARADLVGAPAPAPATPSPTTSCLPACMTRYLATCIAPEGSCTLYMAARPNAWRNCFANGASITAVDGPSNGPQQWTVEDSRRCVTLEYRSGATADTYEWTDRDGVEIASVATGQSLGRRWIVTCDGMEHRIDPDSAECAGDPWIDVIDPFQYRCPLSNQCRPR